MSKFIIVVICVFSMCGCGDKKKEKHVILDSGTELGVRIEVVLKGGGSATLVCPKFNSEPMGAHGRECYLDNYNKSEDED